MGVSNYIPDAHVLDPDGDVIITLHNFDPPFPPLPFEGEQYPEEDGGSLLLETPPLETMKEQKFKKKMTKRMKREIEEMESRAQQASPSIAEELPPEIDHEAHAAEASEAAALEVEEEPSESYGTSEPDLPVAEPIFQFQASSAHLRLGSRYFKKALDGPFRESKFVSDGLRQIDAEGWHMAAFLIVMRIIHGHTRQIPRRIDLEMLAKVATIVDYYQCHETIEPFAEIWHSNLQPLTITNLVNEDLILLLLVSWVFSWPNEFKAVTRIAQTQSKEPLSTMGLPIPERIICKQLIEPRQI
ncbi:hypothetical protein NPX13_g8557 [Xylaria arbuscula]|uniref:BTB domain-containing protein n=1 Tax=Xylaria arbuscula TaxID=114810 RepID=A0A9W8N8G4_9PEZI|nr:hypothetical protein NPX13_g8557 [Xylaria arbuscula]